MDISNSTLLWVWISAEPFSLCLLLQETKTPRIGCTWWMMMIQKLGFFYTRGQLFIFFSWMGPESKTTLFYDLLSFSVVDKGQLEEVWCFLLPPPPRSPPYLASISNPRVWVRIFPYFLPPTNQAIRTLATRRGGGGVCKPYFVYKRKQNGLFQTQWITKGPKAQLSLSPTDQSMYIRT